MPSTMKLGALTFKSPSVYVLFKGKQPGQQVGLSEQDLNRARSVLGLPLTDTSEGPRPQSQRYRSQSYNRGDNSQVQGSLSLS